MWEWSSLGDRGAGLPNAVLPTAAGGGVEVRGGCGCCCCWMCRDDKPRTSDRFGVDGRPARLAATAAAPVLGKLLLLQRSSMSWSSLEVRRAETTMCGDGESLGVVPPPSERDLDLVKDAGRPSRCCWTPDGSAPAAGAGAASCGAGSVSMAGQQ